MTDVMALIDQSEFADVSAAFERAPASAVVRWAWERFGDDLVLASSFQDCVLIDVAVSAAPRMEIVFLDTGYHFPETLDYVETVRRRYDLNLRVMHPAVGRDDWACGSDRCCEFRKVEPLARALEGKAAWLTGLRRAESATRAETPIVARDETKGLVKVNPIATWTDQDVHGYAADHGLPVHPLTSRGYLSIGCAPTTRPVRPGEDPRAGRWSDSDKTECGIHI